MLSIRNLSVHYGGDSCTTRYQSGCPGGQDCYVDRRQWCWQKYDAQLHHGRSRPTPGLVSWNGQDIFGHPKTKSIVESGIVLVPEAVVFFPT